jgi:hypothetical protein
MIEQESFQEVTRLEVLEERLRNARTLTLDLLNQTIDQACPRLAALGTKAQQNITRMIEAGALTDAALTLVELEMPQWMLRRLVWEDSEWHCSLSKQSWLPFGFDEIAEISHQILPLAIVMALVEVRRLALMGTAVATSVPQVRPVEMYSFSCDNYA